MKTLFTQTFSLRMLNLLGLVILLLLIWYIGPLIAIAEVRPLDSPKIRLAVVAGILAFLIVRVLYKKAFHQSSNKKLFERIATHSKLEKPVGSAQIQERFSQAVHLLKTADFSTIGHTKNRFGRFGKARYAYQLPWFFFIGAPGSGKTTALTHSGLRFPFAEALGKDPFQGIGGTRYCDWWFTDQAVLIDTAGRYTTQDSDAATDAREWQELLRIVKDFRPRQVINGVLATISAQDLLAAGSQNSGLRQQANSLRQRITEMRDLIGHDFPVYLLVTKVDLVPGFTQFFEHLPREQREQVWGCTFPLNDARDHYKGLQHLPPELNALEQRLFDQVLDRMHTARDVPNRALIYGFPYQWCQLKESLLNFANEAFSSSQLVAPVWLRGVYFSSGTQEGTPIDRILGSLARSFALENKLLPPQKPSGKSFFITGLLRDIVFPEAGLAGTSSQEIRRLQRLKWGGIAALTLGLVALAGYWTYSYLHNARYIEAVDAKATRFTQALAQHPVQPNELKALLQVLNNTRTLAYAEGVDPLRPPLTMQAGLFQGEKLQAGSQQAYETMLVSYLAPLVSSRIEAGLKQHTANPHLQYETLKAYLMLHDRSKLDVDALKAWVAFDLEKEYGGKLPEEDQQSILQHLEALLKRASLGPNTRADMKLIASVRHSQLQAPFIERVYSRLMRQTSTDQYKDFRIADAAGANGQLVFSRRSGQPLTSGVPGLFTYNGYHAGFNSQLETVLTQLAEEEVWVLGVKDSENTRRTTDPAARHKLANEVRQLYLRDYAAAWEQFLADITLKKTVSLAQSIEQARILSANDSPLPRLLRAIAKEVTLQAPAGNPKNTGDPDAPNKMAGAIQDGKKKLGSLLGTDQLPVLPKKEAVEFYVDRRFEPLRQMVLRPASNQPAPLDKAIGLINDLYGLLTATEIALKDGNAPPRSDLPGKMRAEAARYPEPLKSMLDTLAASSTFQAQTLSRESLSVRLATAVGQPCQAALGGRYPFVGHSKRDATPEDFSRVLAQNGLLDSFFQKHLAAFVDTSIKPWRYRDIGNKEMNSATGALRQFERADEIRKLYFPAGSPLLMFRLAIRVVQMDASIEHFFMDVDGQVLTYSHANIPAMSVQWPGPGATNQIKLETIANGKESVQTFAGPWALFRLFDHSQTSQTRDPERFRAQLNLAGRRVTLEVTTSSVKNPFNLAELKAFQCPMKL